MPLSLTSDDLAPLARLAGFGRYLPLSGRVMVKNGGPGSLAVPSVRCIVPFPGGWVVWSGSK